MRTIWKGAISFGLIHIPIRLYSASKTRELKFKLLHKQDHGEIRYARICKSDGKEIPWEDVVKGYEYEEGDYVILTEADFEKANPKKNKLIEILDFVPEQQIDTIYYQTPYYLEPEKGAEKAYVLLREALKKSKKIAIGKFIFKQHEHLAVIKPHDDALILNQLRYHSELILPEGLRIPKKESVPKQQIDIALDLIDQLSKPFHPSEYYDTYTHEIQEMIKKKAKGQKIAIKKGEEVVSPKIHDIMSLLKQSLEQHKKKPKKRKAA
jgi:DNA end-binding protein Ku